MTKYQHLRIPTRFYPWHLAASYKDLHMTGCQLRGIRNAWSINLLFLFDQILNSTSCQDFNGSKSTAHLVHRKVGDNFAPNSLFFRAIQGVSAGLSALNGVACSSTPTIATLVKWAQA